MCFYWSGFMNMSVLGDTSKHVEGCSIKQSILLMHHKCDRACENQPCKHKKSLIFLSLLYHNLRTVYTNTIKSLSLLQNLMGFLLKVTEMGYHIQS